MTCIYQLNKAYPCPVYAYLDIEHPVVAWNVYRGVLVSSVADREAAGTPISMMFAGLALTYDGIRLQNELFIEKLRQEHYKNKISRLSGMYYFEDLKAASIACNWGCHFNQEYLSELFILADAEVGRHDSNWITYAPRDGDGKLLPRSNEHIARYWEGIVCPDMPPVWELIVRGRAIILGTELREKAYNIIVAHDPKAVSILEVGRISAEIGSDLGNARAYAARDDTDVLQISFYIDMRDADDTVTLEKLSKHTGPKNHKDIAVGGDVFYLPDCRQYSCRFPELDHETAKVLANIHTVE